MLRSLRRKFGISARRMAVRPDLPWYWRWSRAAGVGLFFVAVAWVATYASGVLDRFGEGEAVRQVELLQRTLDRQETELRELRARATQFEIERAATADFAAQVKALTLENAALKEDLAFFQSLMATAGAQEASLSVDRFRLQPEAVPGEYRYQMLLVQRGPRGRTFQGRLELVLEVQHEGRRLVLVLPSEGERGGKDYQLNFKVFQRVEGTFRLAAGSVLEGMHVRVFENGSRTPKLAQRLSVS